LFEPLVKLVVSKLDPLLDLYVERQRLVLMVALPGTLLFLLLFWAFSGAGGFVVVFGLLVMIVEVVLAAAIFLLHEKYKGEIQQWRDVADAIEAFLTKSDVFGEWNAFLETPQRDRRLEQLRVNCIHLPGEYPPQREGEYCGQEGVDLLDTCIKQLRVGLATKASEDFDRWHAVWRQRRRKVKARKAEGRAAAPPKPKKRRKTEAAILDRDQEPQAEPAPRATRSKKRGRRKPEFAPMPGRTAGMASEGAALEKIMAFGLTAHDFDRMQERMLREHGRVPRPNEVVKRLLAEQRGATKRSRKAKGTRTGRSARVAARPMAAAAPVQYRIPRRRGGGGRLLKFVLVVGMIAGAPFAVWRLPRPEGKTVAIVGEVHHSVLDNPKQIRDKLRTYFEELVGNKPVSLMDGRRIYVSEADYKLCWPDTWEVIYEQNYSVRITAEARPLLFGDYSPAKITRVRRVDNAVAVIP
jgi:hypothetical protein